MLFLPVPKRNPCCCGGEECVCSFFDPFDGGFQLGYTDDSTAFGSWSVVAGRARGTASSSRTQSVARPALSGLRMGASITTYVWADPARGNTYPDLWGLIFNGTLSDLPVGPNHVRFERHYFGIAPNHRATLIAFEPDGTAHSQAVDLGDATRYDGVHLRIEIEDVSAGAGTYDIKGYVDGVLGATLSGVALDLSAMTIPIGFYQNDDGEFDDFCIAACNPALPDVCPLCEANDTDPSWTQETTLDTDLGSDAGVIGDCLSIDPCSYYGRQLFLPEDMTSTSCSWASCSEVPSCDGDGDEFDGGPAARIFTETVAASDLLVEEWYVYLWDGSEAVPTVIGRWEAPQTDICGPATLAKVADETTGDYLPATIPIERTAAATCRPVTPCGTVDAGPDGILKLAGTIAGVSFQVCLARGADANCSPRFTGTSFAFTGGTCTAEDVLFELYCDGTDWQLDVTIDGVTATVPVTLDDPTAFYGTVSGTLAGVCGDAVIVADLSVCEGLPTFACYTGDVPLCCLVGATVPTEGQLIGGTAGSCSGDSSTAGLSYGNPNCATTGLPIWSDDRWYVDGPIPFTTPTSIYDGHRFIVSCDGGSTVLQLLDEDGCPYGTPTLHSWDWDTLTGAIGIPSTTCSLSPPGFRISVNGG